MTGGFCRGDIVTGGFCRGDFVTGGILLGGFLSRGIFSGGIFGVGFFPGGFYPGTVLGMYGGNGCLSKAIGLNICMYVPCYFNIFKACRATVPEAIALITK